MGLIAELHDPRRQDLLAKIRSKHGHELGYKTSLLLWFAGIERLEHLATVLETYHLYAMLVGSNHDIFNTCESILQPLSPRSLYTATISHNRASKPRSRWPNGRQHHYQDTRPQNSGNEMTLEASTVTRRTRSKTARQRRMRPLNCVAGWTDHSTAT